MLMAKKMFLLRYLHMYIDVDVGLKKMGGEVWGGGEGVIPGYRMKSKQNL